MKIIATCLAFVILLSPIYVKAQTDVERDPEFGGRFSMSVDKKLTRGLHLNLEEEVRFDNNFASFNRLHTTLGLSYKVNQNFKFGIGYAMINPYDSTTFKATRHRLMADATGSLRFGDWRLSLKERLQATYRTGDMNEYQAPRTAFTLKSRLKLSYRGLQRWEPYIYAELRNTLNAPVINAVYNTTTDTWLSPTTGLARNDAGWFLKGFNGCYVNRLRGALGFEYIIDKHSGLDVCLLADYLMDKKVDANAEGTKLKSYTRETGFIGWFTINYCYSF